jgi:hypothetical protein
MSRQQACFGSLARLNQTPLAASIASTISRVVRGLPATLRASTALRNSERFSFVSRLADPLHGTLG